MGRQVMICGVDCHQGDANCNGYCTGKTDDPPEAPEALVLERAKQKAHQALDAAERAWYEYFGLCDVGPDRIRASDIYERVRTARMR